MQRAVRRVSILFLSIPSPFSPLVCIVVFTTPNGICLGHLLTISLYALHSDSFDTHSFETDLLDLLRPARSSNEFVDSKRSHLPILSMLTLVMHSPKGIFKLDCVKTPNRAPFHFFIKNGGAGIFDFFVNRSAQRRQPAAERSQTISFVADSMIFEPRLACFTLRAIAPFAIAPEGTPG
jgi:hypothetical protein